jgi:hypothetical protein
MVVADQVRLDMAAGDLLRLDMVVGDLLRLDMVVGDLLRLDMVVGDLLRLDMVVEDLARLDMAVVDLLRLDTPAVVVGMTMIGLRRAVTVLVRRRRRRIMVVGDIQASSHMELSRIISPITSTSTSNRGNRVDRRRRKSTVVPGMVGSRSTRLMVVGNSRRMRSNSHLLGASSHRTSNSRLLGDSIRGIKCVHDICMCVCVYGWMIADRQICKSMLKGESAEG